MYLHECYLVPMPVLQAVAAYLEARPYNEVAEMLQKLHGLPNGFSEALVKAGVKIAREDANGMFQIAVSEITRDELSVLGVEVNTQTNLPYLKVADWEGNLVDFPAGVGRTE